MCNFNDRKGVKHFDHSKLYRIINSVKISSTCSSKKAKSLFLREGGNFRCRKTQKGNVNFQNKYSVAVKLLKLLEKKL